jgi:hypothetical protein
MFISVNLPGSLNFKSSKKVHFSRVNLPERSQNLKIRKIFEDFVPFFCRPRKKFATTSSSFIAFRTIFAK